MAHPLERAAFLLQWCADCLRARGKSDDLAAFPYVPEMEEVAEQLRAHVAALPGAQNGWIPVGERLPEARVQVLFVNVYNGKTPIVTYGYKERDDSDSLQWFDMCSTDSDGDYIDVWNVTHWMPLPAPPPPREGGGK